jgi:hypothetical protein
MSFGATLITTMSSRVRLKPLAPRDAALLSYKYCCTCAMYHSINLSLRRSRVQRYIALRLEFGLEYSLVVKEVF